MPLDGYDIYMDPDNETEAKSTTRRQYKRIMMNPPVEFVQAALAAQPMVPVSNEIVFDQGGQAVMVPPSTNGGGDDTSQSEGDEEGDTSPTQAAPPPMRQTPTAEPTQATAPTQTQQSADTASPTVAAPETKSVMEMVTTQVMTATATATPSSAVTPASGTDTPTQVPTETTPVPTPDSSSQSNASSTSSLPAVRVASSAPTVSSSSSSSSNSPSSTSSASASSSSAASSDTPSKPFTQTAPFIFLMVLGSLVLVAVAATLFSTFFRWRDSCGCLPCCRPDHDDEEDGLSDLVRSFDLERTSTAGLSRASSMRSMRRPPPMMDARQVSLQQRSSLFANSPSQAGFLHTQSGVEGSVFESEDEKSRTDHLYGGAGPLEIKNAVEGDIPGETESHAGIGPRHLGVQGNGLEVPWRPSMPMRAYTGSEASYGEAQIPGFGDGNDNGHARGPLTPGEYGGPPFPSPPDTINEQPTRTSTWASNLRSTLFAAISTSPTAGGNANSEPEDRYTRQVLPLHLNRNSTVKSTRSTADAPTGPGSGRNYPLVIDEKDEQEMDAADGAIGSRFMMNRDSGSGDSGGGASAGTRMSIADRYKSWSRGGGGAGAGDDGWPKPVLAGGGRARGATGQYV